MCCSFDAPRGVLNIYSKEIQQSNGGLKLKIKASLDYAPKTLAERCLVFFQNLDLAEKIAHAADEAFHFLRETLRAYCSAEIFRFAQDLHHAGHNIEHGLHSLCFFGDLSAIWAKRFIVYKTHIHHGHEHRDGVDVVRTVARVAFTISHFFATAEFLGELKVITLGRLEPLVKYKTMINFIGFSLSVISMIGRRLAENHQEKDFFSKFTVYASGCLYEGLTLIENLSKISPIYYYLSKVTSLVGIIHASSFAWKLLPSQTEDLSIRVIIPNEEIRNIPYFQEG